MKSTTVKLHHSTKQALDALRTESESYDEVISRLVHDSRHKDLKERLVSAYQSVGEEERKLLKEWDAASPKSN